MEYLDIIDVGELSGGKLCGLNSINRYKNYDIPTFFIAKSEKIIVKYDLGPWGDYLNIDKANDYKKYRFITKVRMPDDLIHPNSLYFGLIYPHPDPGYTIYKILCDLVVNVFKKYNVDVIIKENSMKESYAATVFYNGKEKIFSGMFQQKGIEYPCSAYGLMVNFDRYIDEEEIIFKNQYKKISCWQYLVPGSENNASDTYLSLSSFLGENITRSDINLDFQKELSTLLNLPINNRDLNEDEKILFENMDKSFSDPKWVDDAIHPDFPYIKRSHGFNYWANTGQNHLII